MSKKNSSGLTIMELILTLAILLILIALASPLLAQFSSGYKLRAAAREVATDLQFARLMAVKQNNSFQLIITNSNSYQVQTPDGSLVAKSRSFIIDYPDVTLTPMTVTFNSRGNSTSNAISTITVSNSTGTKNITVGSTGRVKLG